LRIDLPVPDSLDVAAVLLAVAAGIALLRFRLGVVPVLGGCAFAGVVLHVLGAT
jgi:chromate transporter